MSNAEESAIDALVNEVMDARASDEAAAFAAAAESATAPVAEQVAVDDADVSIGFAEGDEPVVESADDDDVASLRAERDGFLADSQRLAADFANYRKQSDKRVADAAATQSAGLVRDLIPVLDACDSALLQDPESAAGPIRSQLIGELEKNGLELLAPQVDAPFDPEQHDAVMHEAAADDSIHDGPIIGEVLRAGYLWKGRVVRPAMVKVVG